MISLTKKMFEDATQVCPLLAETDYIVRIDKVDKTQTAKGAAMAKLFMTIVNPTVFEYGTDQEIQNTKGFLLVGNQMLEASGGMTEKRVIEGVSKILKACFGKHAFEDLFSDKEEVTLDDVLKACVGKYCLVKIKHSCSEEYGDGNDISSYKEIKDKTFSPENVPF